MRVRTNSQCSVVLIYEMNKFLDKNKIIDVIMLCHLRANCINEATFFWNKNDNS